MMAKRIKVPDGLRKAREAAKEQSWDIKLLGSNHLAWIPPWDARPVTTASTMRYERSCKNYIAHLRNAGLEI
jgi:hypothetical protein